MLLNAAVWAAALVLTALAPAASGHPHEKVDKREAAREAHIRRHIENINLRALAACGNTKEIEARQQQAMERRLKTFQRLRRERKLEDGRHTQILLNCSR